MDTYQLYGHWFDSIAEWTLVLPHGMLAFCRLGHRLWSYLHPYLDCCLLFFSLPFPWHTNPNATNNISFFQGWAPEWNLWPSEINYFLNTFIVTTLVLHNVRNNTEKNEKDTSCKPHTMEYCIYSNKQIQLSLSDDPAEARILIEKYKCILP